MSAGASSFRLPRPLRLATADDAEAILEIYRPYITDSVISFEMVAPGVHEMRERIEATLKKFPWLVWEEDGEILGYAYAGSYRLRRAYDWSVEVSVYVRQGRHRGGIGKKLYLALFEILRRQGVVSVIGGIALPNEASVGLHERLGFVKVAHFPALGFKMDQWWDVGFWQLRLQDIARPAPLLAFREILA